MFPDTASHLSRPAHGLQSGADHERLARTLATGFAVDASQRDRERILPHAELQQLRDSGLLAMRVPRDHGGAEIGLLHFARIIRDIATADPNIAQAIAPQFASLEKLRIYGTPEQQAHYYGLVLKGTLIGNAAAERGGNFIGEIATRVVRDGERWRLDGGKYYSTGSLYAELILVTAAHEEGGRAAIFVPSDRAGVNVLDDWDGMGQRTTASGTATFDGVQLSELEILRIPEFGKRRTHEGAFAQLIHAAIDAGIALAALADAGRYGREQARVLPESGVKSATQDPYVLHTIGEMAIRAHGADALLERAALRLDAALQASLAGREDANQLLGEASIAVAEAKYATSEASIRVSEMVFRIGGASATSRAVNLDRHWRNARTHTTHDPVAYKARAVGDFYLNGALPPINTKI